MRDNMNDDGARMAVWLADQWDEARVAANRALPDIPNPDAGASWALARAVQAALVLALVHPEYVAAWWQARRQELEGTAQQRILDDLIADAHDFVARHPIDGQ